MAAALTRRHAAFSLPSKYPSAVIATKTPASVATPAARSHLGYSRTGTTLENNNATPKRIASMKTPRTAPDVALHQMTDARIAAIRA